MNILIIGGNRFVGKLLAQQLSTQSLTLINRTGTGPKNCNLIKCDRNTDQFKKHLKDINPDIVIDMCLYNLNQYDSIKPLLEINNLKKYIFISSIASKIKSFGEYGHQKQLLENKIKDSTLPYIILQPTYIIGEGDHSNRLSQYINNLFTNDELSIEGKGDRLINFIDAKDVRDVVCKLINSDLVRKEYELGCNEITSLNDLIHRLAKCVNKKPLLKYYTNNSPYANDQCFATNFKIKRDIDYSFINFDDTLKQICSSYENKN
mgnify:CR=1 FL=1|jgi:nucleoside-diphosphate-sugar epimerase|tara:strand:+ start:298 stop:1086 length:789 start_codon:yes stop_codon:yes gene_type:complete